MDDFAGLAARLSGSGRLRRVAVAAAEDAHTLESLLRARREGLVEPILVGDPGAIRANLAAAGWTEELPRIVPTASREECAQVAAALARDGEADFLMKGLLETSTLLKAVLAPGSGLRTGRTMSHIAVMELPGRMLAVSDGAMLTYPSLAQKRDEIENAVAALRRMGTERPKVAVMSASEELNPRIPESLEAAELKAMNLRGEIADCVVEGPISYDLAMDPEAAAQKGYSSEVAGSADLMIVPNITAGNLLIKALAFTAGVRWAGFIAGAGVPIVLVSRASSSRDKYLSIVLAAAASASA